MPRGRKSAQCRQWGLPAAVGLVCFTAVVLFFAQSRLLEPAGGVVTGHGVRADLSKLASKLRRPGGSATDALLAQGGAPYVSPPAAGGYAHPPSGGAADRLPLAGASPFAGQLRDGEADNTASPEEAALAALVWRLEQRDYLAAKPGDPADGESKVPSLADYSWQKFTGKSCQGYVNNDNTMRTLEDSKAMCVKVCGCVAIECSAGSDRDCTLRANANLIPYGPADCYVKEEHEEGPLTTKLHPKYESLVKEYSFKSVVTQAGQKVNIILVQAPMNSQHSQALYDKYKDEILFLGLSSFEDYPLPPHNPFSYKYPEDTYPGKYVGFLHQLREPEKVFPPHVKTLLLSQSDMQLPDYPARDYSVPRKWDFTLSGSDQDVANDCVGWSSFAKNWSFVKEALEVFCGEFNMTGVLVATRSKDGKRACTIPPSCKGKMIQTKYIPQEEYFFYLKQSRFAFLPQVYDASPRVTTQALSLDVPILLNRNIIGGWKYLNHKTGEGFHDMSDFRQALRKILHYADVPYHYEPRKWVHEHYGSNISGRILYRWVKDHFSHRVKFPKCTEYLITNSVR